MKKKRTRRENFLAEMEHIVPWARLIAVIEPLYPHRTQLDQEARTHIGPGQCKMRFLSR